jgi:sigma-B regulation protein RsbU (phosphoserine phosphatase)
MNFKLELQEFLNKAPLAIIISDNKGTIHAVNDKSEQLFGYGVGEMIGQPIESLLPENLRVLHEKHRENFFASPSTRMMGAGRDLVGRRKDGTTIPIEVGLNFFQQGDQVHVINFISDISERKKAEEELLLFSRAVEQSITSVIITDKDGVIEYVNPTFLRFSGYIAEEVIGKKPSISKSGNTPREKYQELWHVINSGEEWHGELLNRKKDGSLYWVSASISPVKNSRGVITHFLAIEEDITERKKIEETLRQKNEQISRELDLAGQVQRDFLPEELPVVEGWQFAVALKPARETSGDFYDFRLLPNKNIGLLVADVMDKGVSAALFMALCWFIIRTYADRYPKEPERVLAAKNRRLLQETKVKQFLTMFYGELNPSTGELVYCNAGHPPPLIVSGEKRKTVIELNRTGLPLGLLKDKHWERGVVTLAPGEVLTIYTDGISEAQNARGSFFNDNKLRKTLHKLTDQSAQVILDTLLADVQVFQGEIPQADDIALMVIRRE